MVVNTCYHHSLTFRIINICWWFICCWPIYIFFILMKRILNNIKQTFPLLILTGIMFWFTKKPIMLYSGVLVFLSCTLVDDFCFAFNWLWMKIAWLLNKINTSILLTIIFFFVISPYSLIKRLFTKKTNETKTSFKERNHTYVANDLENLW